MDERMFNDYFLHTPTFGPIHFCKRSRMRRSLFLTIMERVYACDRYFVQRLDACGLVGLSSRQKITAALRMLALGVCTDVLDEYYRVNETTAMEYMKRFYVAICTEFGEYHLRQPTRIDFEK
jgi:hypothetical protein